MTRARRVFQALGANYLAVALMSLLRLMVVPFYLRLLGPELLGFRSFVAESLKYLRLGNLGTAPAMAALVARDLQPGRTLDELPQTRTLLRTGSQMQQLLAAVCLVVTVVAAFFLEHWTAGVSEANLGAARLCLVLFGLAAAMQISSAVWVATLTGQQRQASTSWYRLIEMCLVTLLGVALVALGWSLYGLAVATLLGALAFLILVRRRSHQLGVRLPFWEGRLDLSAVPDLFGMSGWILLANVSYYLSQQSGFLILGMVPGQGMEAVNGLMLLSSVPVMARREANRFGMILLPSLTQVHHAPAEADKSRQISLLFLRVTGLLSVTAFVGLWLGNACFVTLWVGERYFAGSRENLLLAAFVSLGIWTYGYKSMLEVWFDFRRRGLAMFAGGVATCVLSALLVRPYGIAGILIAGLCAESLLVLPFVVVPVIRRLDPQGSGGWILVSVAALPTLGLLAWIALASEIAWRPRTWLELILTSIVIAGSFGLLGLAWLFDDLRRHGLVDRFRRLVRRRP